MGFIFVTMWCHFLTSYAEIMDVLLWNSNNPITPQDIFSSDVASWVVNLSFINITHVRWRFQNNPDPEKDSLILDSFGLKCFGTPSILITLHSSVYTYMWLVANSISFPCKSSLFVLKHNSLTHCPFVSWDYISHITLNLKVNMFESRFVFFLLISHFQYFKSSV